jgi:tetratricopeptide (TPR) repeat protein
MRIAALVVCPLLLVAAIEGGLWIFGYGSSTVLFKKTLGGESYTLNEKFLIQFYSGPAATGKIVPCLIPVNKTSGTTRIFVMGESAAQGTPEPALGFARILEHMLRTQFPSRRFEVVNAAMRGVNSHILAPAARQCAALSPDVFVFYVGNNEVVGLHAPGPDSGLVDRYRSLMEASRWLRSLRVGQWLVGLHQAAKASSAPKQDMEFFRRYRISLDDPRRTAVYRNFSDNLQDMCRSASRSGARIVLSTVAVNWRDCPPLGSLHRPDLTGPQAAEWETLYAKAIRAEANGQNEAAIEQYLAAAGVDDRFAELHFRLGRCLYAMDRFDEARLHYSLACDLDALPFRADSKVNQVIREVAAGWRDGPLVLVDSERILADSQPDDHGIPGQALFRDHVHLTFAGDYLLACALLPTVAAAAGLGTDALGEPPSQAQCAAALGCTAWTELQMDSGIAISSNQPPFLDQLDHSRTQARMDQSIAGRTRQMTKAQIQEAASALTSAIARNPDDWHLHHLYGLYAQDQEDFKTAADQFAFEVGLFPDHLTSRLNYAMALAQAGESEAASVQFKEALRIDPGNAAARSGIAWLQSHTGLPRR